MTTRAKILISIFSAVLLVFIVAFEYNCQKKWYSEATAPIKVIRYSVDGFTLYEDGSMDTTPLTEAEKRELCEFMQ
jgi:uncharacterized membrane protein